MGNRLPVCSADRSSPASAMAAARRLAAYCRSGSLLLRILFRFLQHRGEFYDRCSGKPRTIDPAAPDYGRRCVAGHRSIDRAEIAGVCIAVFGVVAALASGLSAAPAGAWQGELIMTAAVLCMAFYNVWSRPFIRRSSALGFLTIGMGSGAAALILFASLTGRIGALQGFGASQWIAAVYLGVGGGALAFIFWVWALERATPTRVANTMTVNPIAAGLLATQLVGEPITLNLVVGLIAVFAGIWIATTHAAETPGTKRERSRVECS